MTGVGRLEKVPLNEIWKHEALDFTPWLAGNIDVLSKALNLQLRVIETQKTVGSFYLDLLAEDENGIHVVIENQIYKTDHDHLGKVLTYMTNLDAKTAIWLTSDARPEHIRAMAWLNESSPADVSFYLVRVEGFRIGDSLPAPMFSRIVEPSADAKAIGKEKEEIAQRHLDRLAFWKSLLERAALASTFHASLSPTKDNVLATRTGAGLYYAYAVRMHDARVDLGIDRRGVNAREWNKTLFDGMLAQKSEIEAAFGDQLVWERMDESSSCRITYPILAGGLADKEHWAETQETMIDAMRRLHEAADPIASQLIVSHGQD